MKKMEDEVSVREMKEREITLGFPTEKVNAL